VEISILSHLSSLKQQTPIEPSGENGQQRHYDLLIADKLHIGGVGKSLRAETILLNPNG
jgi:hypothetical protein